MLNLTGRLMKTFKQPKGERDGKEYGGQDKIQVMGEIPLPDGDTKLDLYTLTTHNIDYFNDFVGKNISVPIGVFLAGRTVAFFIPKGSKPEIAQ